MAPPNKDDHKRNKRKQKKRQPQGDNNKNHRKQQGNRHHVNEPRGRPHNRNNRQQQRASTRTVRAPALGPNLPELVITYTIDPIIIAQWLQDHVQQDEDCLGLDMETKPAFTREAAKAAKGPDVLQLAKANGQCLVIHLSLIGGPPGPNHPSHPLRTMHQALQSQSIAKAGVGIDQDALEMYENKEIQTNCRLDLRDIPKLLDQNQKEEVEQDGNQAQLPRGLKGLAEYYVPTMTLPKLKKLQLSNWALPLSDEQIGYAAGDAFAAAIAVQAIVNDCNNGKTATATGGSGETRDKTDDINLGSIIGSVCQQEVDIVHYREDLEQKRKERKRQKETENKKKKQQQQPPPPGKNTKAADASSVRQQSGKKRKKNNTNGRSNNNNDKRNNNNNNNNSNKNNKNTKSNNVSNNRRNRKKRKPNPQYQGDSKNTTTARIDKELSSRR